MQTRAKFDLFSNRLSRGGVIILTALGLSAFSLVTLAQRASADEAADGAEEHTSDCSTPNYGSYWRALGPFFHETHGHEEGEGEEPHEEGEEGGEEHHDEAEAGEGAGDAGANASEMGSEGLLGGEIGGSFALIHQGSEGFEFLVHATELQEGHIYTLQALMFNQPDQCLGNLEKPQFRCGLGDMINARGEFSAITVAGKLVRKGTSTFFKGEYLLGDTTGVWIGDGFSNADAEISFDILHMGLPIPGLVDEQLTTPDAGCGPGEPNDNGGLCVDFGGNAF